MSMAFLRGHGATGNLGLPGASRAHRMRSESPRRRREVRRECKHLSLWQEEAQAGARGQGPAGARGCGVRRGQEGTGGGGGGCGEDGEGLRAGESECFLPEENVLRGQKYNYIFKKCERQPGN